MKKSPGFAAVAILTLAVGIGGTTAVFSVVYQLLLRPLPYSHAEQLAVLVTRFHGGESPNVVAPVARAAEERSRAFESVGVHLPSSGCNLAGGSEAEYVPAMRVTAGYLPTLGVAPILGRSFNEADAIADPTGHLGSVAVISYGLWQRRFGGKNDAIGTTVACNGHSLTVIGVLPREFFANKPADVWTVGRLADYSHDDGTNYSAIVRLRPGTSLGLAQQELDRMFADLRRENPGHWWTSPRQPGPGVVSYRKWEAGDARQPVLVLFGAVMLVLLIACANVAGLLLARASGRGHEFAVRVALGAGRGRITAQVLTEAVLLGVFGGAAGVALSVWMVTGLRALVPTQASIFSLSEIDTASLGLHAPVLLFALAVTLLTGILCGLAQARATVAAAPLAGLRSGERSGRITRAQHRARKTLVVAQVATALVLLAGAMLLARSFAYLRGEDLGFAPQNLHVAQLSYASEKFTTADAVSRYESAAIAKITAIPGVVAAGATSSAPMMAGLNLGAPEVNGKQCNGGGIVDYRAISPSYFQALGVPVVLGRNFADADSAPSAPVIIVNQATARACWHGQSPLHQLISVDQVPREVVGVVRDVKEYDPSQAAPPVVYVPQPQVPAKLNLQLYRSFGLLSAFVVRTSHPMDLTVPLRRALEEVDPEQPIIAVLPMSQLVTSSIAFSRLLTALMASFAALAVGLTAIGLFGLLSFYVNERRQEIGIRMALGATRANVLRMVVAEGLWLALAGSVLGLAGAFAATRLLASVIFGVTPHDVPSLLLTVVLIAVVALAASYFPARRATEVDPMLALRQF